MTRSNDNQKKFNINKFKEVVDYNFSNMDIAAKLDFNCETWTLHRHVQDQYNKQKIHESLSCNNTFF